MDYEINFMGAEMELLDVKHAILAKNLLEVISLIAAQEIKMPEGTVSISITDTRWE